MNLNKETSKKSCQLNNFRDSLEYSFFSKHQGLLNFLQRQALRSFKGINLAELTDFDFF